MARIFSIQFLHEDIPQTAMVSVRSTPFFIEYKISMMNEEVLKMLPGNTIISSSPNQFVFANAAFDESTELMQDIIRAISNHSHTLA